ncbi:hypothetical protein [Pontibacter sp. G13]|uniref:hypothetical protein n=1 Tax=Pontibacter sp. G13 TaxID=3074898 RepID=UPI00288B96E6|nr:hypothetical protein [Pontibacter sp. G13]WNJ15958.1 hypothetical protein RJD25_13935 [Pontibacter sp. G13]
MRRTPHFALLVACSILLSACQPDPAPAVYQVPDIIEPYIDLFELEASKRGITLEVDNLIVEFESNLQNGDAAGLCTFATESSPTPVIHLDTNSYNWRNNEWHREILVFHELGHCILNRLHKDDVLPNGSFASIMRSTGEQMYGGQLNAFKRDYYLDELFNPETAAPDWALNAPSYSSIPAGQKTARFLEEFDNNTNGWFLGNSSATTSTISGGRFFFQSKQPGQAFYTSNSIDIDENRNFEIEIEVRIVDGDGAAIFQWGAQEAAEMSYLGMTKDSAVFVGTWDSGLATGRTVDSFNPNGFNKLTIRKLEDQYHIYINEFYFDILSFRTFTGNQVGFYIGPNTSMEVESLRVFDLP